MLLPTFLEQGATIAIVCPSGYLPQEKSLQAAAVLNEWGYEVLLGTTTRTEHHYFAATDEQRLQDVQWALDHPNVRAILMGRGGYGLSRIIDQLDFTQFVLHPKWIIGFSDITVLHSHIYKNFGIATLHAPMCGSFAEDQLSSAYMKAYREVLRGQKIDYCFPGNENNVEGFVTGTVIGGNLCMLDHLTGSVSCLDTSDAILFIEDIGEYLYKIDRMLLQLKRSGQLSGIKALLCGNFSDMEDTVRAFGASLYEIILEQVRPYGIPVAFELPIGHETINYPLILGAHYQIAVSKAEVVIRQLDHNIPLV